MRSIFKYNKRQRIWKVTTEIEKVLMLRLENKTDNRQNMFLIMAVKSFWNPLRLKSS